MDQLKAILADSQPMRTRLKIGLMRLSAQWRDAGSTDRVLGNKLARQADQVVQETLLLAIESGMTPDMDEAELDKLVDDLADFVKVVLSDGQTDANTPPGPTSPSKVDALNAMQAILQSGQATAKKKVRELMMQPGGDPQRVFMNTLLPAELKAIVDDPASVDADQVAELGAYLKRHWPELRDS